MHAYISEYGAGPVRSHRAGEHELNTQLILSVDPRCRKLHRFWQSWQSFLAAWLICIASPSLFPERMQDGVERACLI